MRECVSCKYGKGLGSDVWCGHDPKGKESYMHDTDCPYFENINQLDKTCETCQIRYDDGFCMQHCYYTDNKHSCPQWSSQSLKFNYERIYQLCNNFIKLCKDYEEFKELCNKYPKKIELKLMEGTYEFFFNCCLNDLHREMNLWRTKR